DLLIESIRLLNGFECDLMWSGSAAAMASNPYKRVINDEVDIFETWTGEQSDPITATEGRLTSYGDSRLQINTSTPTTTAGTIHRLYERSTARLEYHVPCPHCGHMQPLIWKQLKWLSLQAAEAHLAAAREAQAAGGTEYAARCDDSGAWTPCPADADGASPVIPGSADAMGEHVGWLERLIDRLRAAEGRRELADALNAHRGDAIWYECRQCHGRIGHREKAAMIRAGRWRSTAGPVADAAGGLHEDAEDVGQWPPETRIGATLTALNCTWIHWGTLVSQWLGAQGDPAALFFFVTFRLGEPFEFRSRRVPEATFAGKSARAPLPAEIVPAWAWTLLATIDTQPDLFYVVVRAWGGSMRSARVWHGKVNTFADLDRLLYQQTWAMEDGSPPARISRALIDSGGTMDKILDVSRTQQVYQWAIPRQQTVPPFPTVTAIKGASRPGLGLYWPMRNPMSGGGAAQADYAALRAIMVDPHKANDLLAEMIAAGTPGIPPRPGTPAAEGETWMLNKTNDPEYNAHMAGVQRTMDPKSRAEVWRPKSAGTRHDYRDCEAYQIIAAYLSNVHLLPSAEEVTAWKQQQAAGPATPRPPAAGDDQDRWTPQPL
ncbi:MAG TPA: terminase gpA endonuclease subunit, partial [Phycisphaerae bacterium]|nr:terminase gpA endonuclease subunit [Phycisphaerae bacterium]